MTTWTKACEAMKRHAELVLRSGGDGAQAEIVKALPLPTPPPSETGEGPVAWKLQSSDGNTHQIIESPPNPHDYEYWTVVPLYSSSSVPARELAEPSEEWVHRIAEMMRGHMGIEWNVRTAIAEYRKLAGANRAVGAGLEADRPRSGDADKAVSQSLPAAYDRVPKNAVETVACGRDADTAKAAHDEVGERSRVSDATLDALERCNLEQPGQIRRAIYTAVMALYDAMKGLPR